MEHQLKEKSRKQYIDMIRAFSASMVFLYHFCGTIKPFGMTVPLVYGFKNGNWGNVAVFLFFMISGNCLMYKYEESFEVKAFFKSRFFKLMIPFWLCYIIAFLVNFWQTKAFPEIPLYKFVYTLIGMDGFLAYRTDTFYILGEWFLGSIIIIYLLFPLLRICIKKYIHVTIGILFVLNCLLYYNNFWGFFKINTGRNLLVGMFYFVLGVWLEQMIQRIHGKIKAYLCLAICLCGAIFLFIKLPVNIYIGNLVVAIALYIFFMSIEKIMHYNVIAKVVKWLSANSYLIFLTHHVIIQKVAAHFSDAVFSLKGVGCILLICMLFIGIAIKCVNKILSEGQKNFQH